jgi:hypothetical protein
MTTPDGVSVSALAKAQRQGAAQFAPLPWRTLVCEAAKLWLVWQAILLVFTYTALTFILSDSQRPSPPVVVTPSSLYGAWVHLDGNWYVAIAMHGYGGPVTLDFYPLYPLAIRVVASLCFGNFPLAAVLVARCADFGVCLGVLALAWQEVRPDRGIARLALAITLAFPLAFFLSAAYTESLVLAEASFALLFARRRAWWPAAAIAFVAMLTHPRGILLFLPLTWEWARAERPWENWRAWRSWSTGLLVVAAVPLGLLTIAGLDALETGDPLATFHVHANFGRTSMAPWQIVKLAFGIFLRSRPGTLDQAHNVFDIGMVLLVSAVVVLAAARGRMPPAFVLYSAGLLVAAVIAPTPNGSDVFLSAGRAIVPSVPAFLALAGWAESRPWLTWLLVGGGLCLEVTLAAFWVNGGFLI